MIFLFILFVIFLLVGLACLGLCNDAKTEKQKQNLREWGEAFACGSIFPFLIILMCVL